MNTNLGAILTQFIATVTQWARLFASLFLVLIVAVALADLLGFRTPYLSVNANGTNLAAVIAAAAFALRG